MKTLVKRRIEPVEHKIAGFISIKEMNHNLATRITLLVLLVLLVVSRAEAVEIELKSAQYSTYVARGDSGFPAAFRTNFAPVPIRDFYTNTDEFSTVEADADAALFTIFTLAGAKQHQNFPGFSEAFVETEFTFAPLSDALAQVHLEFFTKGQYAYGGNDVSLYDITAGILLWNYYDQGFMGGNIVWTFDDLRGGMVASLDLPTQLLASHDYKFKMSSRGTSIFPDFDSRLTQLSGLTVPEPTALSLVLFSGACLFARRRWRARSS